MARAEKEQPLEKDCISFGAAREEGVVTGAGGKTGEVYVAGEGGEIFKNNTRD